MLKTQPLYISASPVHAARAGGKPPRRSSPDEPPPSQLPAILVKRVPPRVNILPPRSSGNARSRSIDTGLDELRKRSGHRPRPHNKDEMAVVEMLRSSMDRKSRFVEVDNEAMRKAAEERAQTAQRAAAEKAKQKSDDAARKRQEAIDRRNRDAEAKVQRRAEIYALNAVMNEIARRNFIRATAEKQSGDTAVAADEEGGEEEEGLGRDSGEEAASASTAAGAEAAVNGAGGKNEEKTGENGGGEEGGEQQTPPQQQPPANRRRRMGDPPS